MLYTRGLLVELTLARLQCAQILSFTSFLAVVSFDRQSQGSHMQTVPLVPNSNSSSLYGALYVDLPAKDLRTFYNSPLPHFSNPSLHTVDVMQAANQRLVPHCGQNLRIDSASVRGATQQEPQKTTGPLVPNLMPQASWEKSSKKGKIPN